MPFRRRNVTEFDGGTACTPEQESRVAGSIFVKMDPGEHPAWSEEFEKAGGTFAISAADAPECDGEQPPSTEHSASGQVPRLRRVALVCAVVVVGAAVLAASTRWLVGRLGDEAGGEPPSTATVRDLHPTPAGPASALSQALEANVPLLLLTEAANGLELHVTDPLDGSTSTLSVPLLVEPPAWFTRSSGRTYLLNGPGSPSLVLGEDGAWQELGRIGADAVVGESASDALWAYAPGGGVDLVRLELGPLGLDQVSGAIRVANGSIAGNDGNGGVVIHASGSVFVVTGSGSELVTDGELLAIGANHYLVRECDSSLVCGSMLISRQSGERSALVAGDDVDPVGLRPGIGTLTTISPDGSRIVARSDRSATGWVLISQDSGSDAIPIDGPDVDSPIIWFGDEEAVWLSGGRLIALLEDGDVAPYGDGLALVGVVAE